MKIRKSFVSNSSSCSFFVYFKTDEDVTAFNQIKDLFKCARDGKIYVYRCGLKNFIENGKWNYTESPVDNVQKGDLFSIYTGEDNEGDFRETQLDEEFRKLTDHYPSFTLYRDPDAHYSYGSRFPKLDELPDDE